MIEVTHKRRSQIPYSYQTYSCVYHLRLFVFFLGADSLCRDSESWFVIHLTARALSYQHIQSPTHPKYIYVPPRRVTFQLQVEPLTISDLLAGKLADEPPTRLNCGPLSKHRTELHRLSPFYGLLPTAFFRFHRTVPHLNRMFILSDCS